MSRGKILLASMLAFFIAFSLLPKIPAASAATPTKWTVMVYMAADNDLEAAAIDDFLEMAEVTGLTGRGASVRVLVQLDRAMKCDLPDPSDDDERYDNWTSCRRYEITTGIVPDNRHKKAELREVNMGEYTVLRDFIKWAVRYAPAEHYCLVLWDHGYGWLSPKFRGGYRGVCYDFQAHDDHLNTTEIVWALEEAGVHFDVIAFDACLMQMIEVEYPIRKYADYIVASEDLVQKWGMPYNTTLQELVNNPDMTGREFAETMVDKYAEFYGPAGKQPFENATISAVDTSNLDTLVSSVDNFAARLWEITKTNWEDIYEASTSSEWFGTVVDLLDFAQQIYNDPDVPSRVQDAAWKVMFDVDTAVIAEWHGSGHEPGAYGIAIDFLPFARLFFYEGGWTGGLAIDSMRGHAVRLTPPDPIVIKGVWVYGQWYGTEDREFHIEIWDDELNVLYKSPYYKYSDFFSHSWDWAWIPVPNVFVAGDFYVCLFMNTTDSDGVYIAYESNPPCHGRSYIAYMEPRRVEQVPIDSWFDPERDDWMIGAKGFNLGYKHLSFATNSLWDEFNEAYLGIIPNATEVTMGEFPPGHYDLTFPPGASPPCWSAVCWNSRAPIKVWFANLSESWFPPINKSVYVAINTTTDVDQVRVWIWYNETDENAVDEIALRMGYMSLTEVGVASCSGVVPYWETDEVKGVISAQMWEDTTPNLKDLTYGVIFGFSQQYPIYPRVMPILLQPGWNLISLPLIPTTTDAATLLKPVAKWCQEIWTYDANRKRWYWAEITTDRRGRIRIRGSLRTLEAGKGYWIKATGYIVLPIEGYLVPPKEVPPTYPVYKGWNLIGVKYDWPIKPTDYLGDVASNTRYIFAYDPSSGTTYMLDINGSWLTPCNGYWLYVEEDDEIVPPASGI